MNNGTLTPKQSEAVIHLVEADTVSEAARRTGVSRTTLYSWLKEPAFRRELDLARRADHQARLNALRALLPKALQALSKLLDDRDPQVRLKASAEVIKACQALAVNEPPEAAPLLAEGEALSEEDVPAVAQRCLEGLVNGTLDARAASMAPQYLLFLDKSLKEQKIARMRAAVGDRKNLRKFVRTFEDSMKDPAFREKVAQIVFRRSEELGLGDGSAAEETEEGRLQDGGFPGRSAAQAERVLS